MKGIRRLYMAGLGFVGWLSMCLLIYSAINDKNNEVIVNFNSCNEMIFEIVLFTFFLVFFVICIVLEFIDYWRNL